MPSRRDFLSTVTAGLAASVAAPVRAAFTPPEQTRGEAGRDEIKTALNGPVGLQLWSLRKYGPVDLPGTLAKIRGMGFRDVESASLWKHTTVEMRAALDTAGLRCRSAHMDFARLRDHAAEAMDEAKAIGASWVVCPWVKDGKPWTREEALASAEAFNQFGKAAQAAGLRFAYHCHGYEFIASPEGTFFDTMAAATDPALVSFQIDVFHAFLGGADPVALIDRYKGRVSSLHLKDLKKGFPVKAGTATAPADADVPLGTGQVDMAAVLRAAIKVGTSLYFIEDESADPLAHIPESVAYLETFRDTPA
jgi:sugar phosphate isomerase/epimerase